MQFKRKAENRSRPILPPPVCELHYSLREVEPAGVIRPEALSDLRLAAKSLFVSARMVRTTEAGPTRVFDLRCPELDPSVRGMTAALISDLKAAIARTDVKPLLLCGAGVSIHATGGRAPQWQALIRSGINRVLALDETEDAWAAYAERRLERGTPDEWIEVADEVTARLGGDGNAEFRTWLKDELASLQITDFSLIESLAGLNAPIATTNYDDVLSAGTGFRPVAWTEYDDSCRILTADDRGILHLHGYWRDPSSVILGKQSYDRSIKDTRRTFLQHFLAISRPTILIGCSRSGIEDPDFSNLDSFVGTWQNVAERRYWLVKKDFADLDQTKVDHARRIYPIVYGKTFDELPTFLSSLTPATDDAAAGADDIRCIDQHEPRPVLFGRSDDLDDLVAAILEGRSTAVAGAPGIGKTALATAALYDDRVVKSFDRRRVFVSIETATEPRAMLSRLAESLDLPSAGDDSSLLRILELYFQKHRVAAILDNAEGIFESDPTGSERIFRLLGQLDGLSPVLTIRGTAPPIPDAYIIGDLPKLDLKASEEAFLAVAGKAMKNDLDLPMLLSALDGHALSIQLVAAQAIGLPDLSGVRETWEEIHAGLLKRPGVEESRLTSVRASLALSLRSQRLENSPFSRLLLAALAFLPGGLDQGDVSKLLGKLGGLGKARVNDIVGPLHQLRLVERRPDRRLRMLNPLRESVKLEQRLFPADKDRLLIRYLKLAAQGNKVGTSAWPDVQAEVESEIDNIDVICAECVKSHPKNRLLWDALLGLEQLVRFTGQSSFNSILAAKDAFEAVGMVQEAASAVTSLARVYLARDERATSIKFYQQGIILARAVGHKQIEANCTAGLGRVNVVNSNHVLARVNFLAAKEIYDSIGDKLGAANCTSELGELCARELDIDRAKDLLLGAIEKYGSIGHILGIASVNTILANINEDNEEFVNEARRIFTQLNDQNSALNLLSLDIRLANSSSDYQRVAALSREFVERARLIGDFGSEEYGFARWGLASLKLGDLATASSKIALGLSHYLRRAPEEDLAKPGWEAVYTALFTSNFPDRKAYLGDAQAIWEKIGRRDLIKEWVNDKVWEQEFSLIMPDSAWREQLPRLGRP